MRPSAREFAEFNGLLRSVVEKNLPLAPAIDLMGGVVRERGLRDALTGVSGALRDGASLADALGRHPDVFPTEYCALVRAGAESGRLAEVLRSTEIHYAYRARLRSKVSRLLFYLLAGAFVGEIVLLITLVAGSYVNELNNQIMDRYALGIRPNELEESITTLADSGWLLLIAWPLSVLLISGLYLAVQRWTSFGWIGYVLPLWGQVEKSRDLSLFCSTVGLRLRSGAPMVEALRAAEGTIKNHLFRRSARRVIKRVEDGEAFSSALFYVSFFPKTMSWGMSLGEENGDVLRSLDTFAALYTAQMERNFEVLYELLTPLGVLAVGNVAFLAATMMLAPFLKIVQISETF